MNNIMLLLYNILQLFLLPIVFPFIGLFLLFSAKHRVRIPSRLGFNVGNELNPKNENGEKTIWIHALSVGEVTAAVPLIEGLLTEISSIKITVTVWTKGGKETATRLLADKVEHILFGPFDIYPVVNRFIKKIQPDLYILIETDFWPNMLFQLKQHNVPTLLVNGRISAESLKKYKQMWCFFRPLFEDFTHISMQTNHDLNYMKQLEISEVELHSLGNLKFDTAKYTTKQHFITDTLLPQNKTILICGSTHEKEEKILLKIYQSLRLVYPSLFIAICPRDPKRAKEIQRIGQQLGLEATLKSEGSKATKDYLIIDTIGELIFFYKQSHIAFVGGSLVPIRGHNPIEPAAFGTPVLFGPSMQDFHEIAELLVLKKGAIQIDNQTQLTDALTRLLNSPSELKAMGKSAKECIDQCRGVVKNHTDLIRRIL